MKLTVPLEVSKTVAYGDDEFDVIVRQPMQREYLQREELWERAQEEKRLFWGYIQAWDVYFTLVEADLESDDGPVWHPTKLKNKKLTFKEFLKGWELLPPEVCNGLWEAAVEVAPDWDFRKRVTDEGTFPERSGVSEAPAE